MRCAQDGEMPAAAFYALAGVIKVLDYGVANVGHERSLPVLVPPPVRYNDWRAKSIDTQLSGLQEDSPKHTDLNVGIGA